MGLGSFYDVTLKEARKAAEKWRVLARQGVDPVKERQRREAERSLHCLADIALDTFASHKAELKNDSKAGRRLSPLELHVLPKTRQGSPGRTGPDRYSGLRTDWPDR